MANNFLRVIYSLKNQYSYDVTRNNLKYYYLNIYFSLLSDTIYSDNSVEFTKNKPEFIQNYGRTELFPGNF